MESTLILTQVINHHNTDKNKDFICTNDRRIEVGTLSGDKKFYYKRVIFC